MSLKHTEIFRCGNPCHGDTTLLNGMGTYFPWLPCGNSVGICQLWWSNPKIKVGHWPCNFFYTTSLCEMNIRDDLLLFVWSENPGTQMKMNLPSEKDLVNDQFWVPCSYILKTQYPKKHWAKTENMASSVDRSRMPWPWVTWHPIGTR